MASAKGRGKRLSTALEPVHSAVEVDDDGSYHAVRYFMGEGIVIDPAAPANGTERRELQVLKRGEKNMARFPLISFFGIATIYIQPGIYYALTLGDAQVQQLNEIKVMDVGIMLKADAGVHIDSYLQILWNARLGAYAKGALIHYAAHAGLALTNVDMDCLTTNPSKACVQGMQYCFQLGARRERFVIELMAYYRYRKYIVFGKWTGRKPFYRKNWNFGKVGRMLDIIGFGGACKADVLKGTTYYEKTKGSSGSMAKLGSGAVVGIVLGVVALAGLVAAAIVVVQQRSQGTLTANAAKWQSADFVHEDVKVTPNPIASGGF